jgi:hypothetical protein
MLLSEQKRHHDEVSRISRFHKFITEFEENGGMINGKPYKLSGIGDCVARFEGVYGDYFYDAEVGNLPD